MVKGKKIAFMVLAIVLVAMASVMPVMAEDDLIYDSYDRTNLEDFASSVSSAAWAGGDAGKRAMIDGNALKLEYGSSGWFGTGGGIDASEYKYLKIRVKGAAGGEGADFNLNYAVGETVKTTDKSFADLVGSNGKKVPAISKSFQDIVIDLAANNIDSGIQAFHFNFHEGASGTIWIDSITFTNSAGSVVADSGSGSVAAPANPKTGDVTNLALYVIVAALAGGILLTATLRGKSHKA